MGALNGKVALVTGGARGQGRAHALALAGEGATVAVCDLAEQIATVDYPMATKRDLDETGELLARSGATYTTLVTDVRDSAQVEGAVAEVLGRWGRLDILVANAGICSYSRFDDLSDESWSSMIDTNLSGVFYCMRAVVPTMRKQQYGRIVAISSAAARLGSAHLAHYTAAKWGVIGLVKTVALETARSGITVNAVCPTSVRTPMVQNEQNYRQFCRDLPDPTEEDAKGRMAAMNPMGRPWLEPEDVTRTVLYLVSDPGVISGSVLDVCMGSSAKHL